MLNVTSVTSFFDINHSLAEGFKLITQAIQMESVDPAGAQTAKKEAANQIKGVVSRPDFKDFTKNALYIIQDEVGSKVAPDSFERRHVAPEVDWDKCTVANATGTACLLELARKHPDSAQQCLALEALRTELVHCCNEVARLSDSDIDSLMLVIEMMNEVNGLTQPQMKQVIDKFVAKQALLNATAVS